jgi:fumarate hydratase class II
VGSIFELNVAMPVIADAIMESIELLAHASGVLVDKLLTGLDVDRQRCRETIERSLMTVTALAPALGYDAAAVLVKEAAARGVTIRQMAIEKKLLAPAQIDELLDPRKMTQPGHG